MYLKKKNKPWPFHCILKIELNFLKLLINICLASLQWQNTGNLYDSHLILIISLIPVIFSKFSQFVKSITKEANKNLIMLN